MVKWTESEETMSDTAGSTGHKNVWVEYWNSDNTWSHSSLWRKQMDTFVRLSSDLMGYCQDDKVLDFGCGVGHFAENVANNVGSVVCADMSDYYVNVCNLKFASKSNVIVRQVKPDMSDISTLGSGFTKIICFSVVHYFADLDHVTAFVRGMQQISVSGSKMIIGDIGHKGRTIQDILKSLAFVLREGMVVDVIGLLCKIWLADARYRKVKQRGHSYLQIPDGFWESLGVELGIKVTTLPTQFTVNANYKNVLMVF